MGKNIKVGKNQIFKEDDGLWTVEVFEFNENGKPMYSVFASFKTKKQATNIARIVNVNNESRIRNKLMDNPNYLA